MVVMWLRNGSLGLSKLDALVGHPVMARVLLALLLVGIITPVLGIVWSPAGAALVGHLLIAGTFAAALLPDAIRTFRRR